MKYENMIDLLSNIGKFKMEVSNLPQDEKEYRKAQIDLASELLKSFVTTEQTQQKVFGCSLDKIMRIKNLAQKYGTEKVVLIPVPDNVGHGGPLLKCYGKNSEKFMNEMNLEPVLGSSSEENIDLIAECEKQFGVIIYEREN